MTRGTRLPEDWRPSAELFAKGEELGIDRGVLYQETDAFRDYWLSRAGAGAVKLDWDRTWMNWMRKLRRPLPTLGRNIPRTGITSAPQFRPEPKTLSDEEWRVKTGRLPRKGDWVNPYKLTTSSPENPSKTP